MNKVCVIVTNSHSIKLAFAICLLNMVVVIGNVSAQEAAKDSPNAEKPAAEEPAAEEPAAEKPAAEKPAGESGKEKSPADEASGEKPAVAEADSEPAVVTYPRAVALEGDGLLVVDLDLPGIWRVQGEKRELYVRGTKLLRKPMNRPWCVVPHPGGGILVGDSATREVYAFEGPDTKGTPLTNGYIGIPMALAVSPDKKTIYVGDAEKRAVFSLPIGGGKPELVARVNARGLSFDEDGNLWAITPDAAAVQKIDVKGKKAETVVDGRPYQFPNGIVWAGDHGYVTDGYGKSIWKFTADGKTEKWFDSDALARPVGITANEKSVFVVDPVKKQVLEIDRESKKVTERL